VFNLSHLKERGQGKQRERKRNDRKGGQNAGKQEDTASQILPTGIWKRETGPSPRTAARHERGLKSRGFILQKKRVQHLAL
jgi:hypothetical protein